MNTGLFETLGQIINLVSAFFTALYNFMSLGKGAFESIKQLPELKAERKAEEVRQNKEIAQSIVHLFAIEALFTFGRGLLMTTIFAIQTIALARFVELLLRRGLHDPRSPDGSGRRD